jgi:hypothetical protein
MYRNQAQRDFPRARRNQPTDPERHGKPQVKLRRGKFTAAVFVWTLFDAIECRIDGLPKFAAESATLRIKPRGSSSDFIECR